MQTSRDAMPGHRDLRLSAWHTLRTAVFWAYEGAPIRLHKAEPDPGHTAQAWLLRQGSVKAVTKRGAATARRGQWMFVTSRKVSHDFSDDAEILSVNFRVHWLNDEPLYRLDPPVVSRGEDHPRLEKAAAALSKTCARLVGQSHEAVRLVDTRMDVNTYLKFRLGVHRFITAYAEAMEAAGVEAIHAGEGDERVAAARRHLEAMPLTERLDEAKLARSVGLSSSQLTRLFVAELHVTPKAYELRRRLQTAREYVGKTELPLKQVAYLLGFRHPAHFTSWFRKHTGSSPRESRRSILHPGVSEP